LAHNKSPQKRDKENSVNIIDNTLEYYINLLKEGKKFSFTRWGDGEWLCLFGKQGHNIDCHTYFPEMSKELNNVFTNYKGYFLATWPQDRPMMARTWNPIKEYLSSKGLNFDWVNATVWEERAIKGTISPLINQLEKMNFIIVSEASKRDLPMKYVDFIEVPSTNCYLEKSRIKQEMLQMCAKYSNPVFGLSASMATNVIVDELYPTIGDECWMIDFGSIWEPYLKPSPRRSRSYHVRYKTKEL
tara:strand:- start:907 stop:1638 length:732 start_codon:yes stop_codon:yes gene_type:complete